MDDILENIIVGIIVAVVSGVSVFLIQRYISNRRISEKDLFWLWNRAFSRPAFQEYFTWYSDRALYVDTLDDLIRIINTGKIERGTDPLPGYGKAYLKNADRRAKMDNIVRRLTKIKTTMSEAERRWNEKYATIQGEVHQDRRDALQVEMDAIRKESKEVIDTQIREILTELNEIWAKLGIPTLPIPVEGEKQ